MTNAPGSRRHHLASSPFKPQVQAPVEQYSVDDRVSHDLYGLGRVISAEEGAVTVHFGEKTVRIVSPYAKMEKL
jgi:hypothetical protein